MRPANSVAVGWVQWLCLCTVLLLPLPSVAQESLQPLLQRLATAGEVQIAGASVHDLPVTQELYARAGYAPVWTNPQAFAELVDRVDRIQTRTRPVAGVGASRDTFIT